MANNTISVNLKRIRTAKGINQEHVAKVAGLSRVAYSSIESGKSEPRVSNLQKIANAFDVGIEDLVAPVPTIKSLRFRSNKMPTQRDKSKRDQVVIDVAYWLKDFSDIEGYLEKDEKCLLSNFERGGSDAPEKVAMTARELLNLKPDEAINDICGLLENAGVKIRLISSEIKNFFGLSALDESGLPAIVVNIGNKIPIDEGELSENIANNVSVERQIFTVAHELGHILLHRNSFKSNEQKELKREEEEANRFASHFLMPKAAFEKSWTENKGLHWIDNVLHTKRVYKVSYMTILKRLVDEGASSAIYRTFAQLYKIKYKKDLKNYREPFPLQEIDFIEDKLSGLVREAYENELISFGRAAEILQVDTDTLRERINSWEWDSICEQE